MAPEQRLLWRVRMEAGRIGDRGRRSQPAAARNRITPFPFPLRGKPGREGSPHAAKSAAPPTRGLRPLVNPPRFSTGWLTGAGLLMEAATARERFLKLLHYVRLATELELTAPSRSRLGA